MRTQYRLGIDAGGTFTDFVLADKAGKVHLYKALSTPDDPTRAIENGLKLITEDQKTFEDRRNRFLDHLMGRFAEQFTDYVLLMYEMEGPVAPQKLIFDKILFLQDYPEISANRGKAFDYTQCQGLWGSESSYGGNVSGYLKRLSRLSGITRYDRRYLNSEEFTGKYTIFKGVDGQWYFHFGIAGNVLLHEIAQVGGIDAFLHRGDGIFYCSGIGQVYGHPAHVAFMNHRSGVGLDHEPVEGLAQSGGDVPRIGGDGDGARPRSGDALEHAPSCDDEHDDRDRRSPDGGGPDRWRPSQQRWQYEDQQDGHRCGQAGLGRLYHGRHPLLRLRQAGS